jgi:uncharacterized phage protein (TIGR02220 family)
MTLEEWAARICVTPSVMRNAMSQFVTFRVAEIITQDNGTITLKSRRMLKERDANELNKLRQQRFRDRWRVTPHNANVTGNVTPLSRSCNGESQNQSQNSESEEDKKKSPPIAPPGGLWRTAEEIISFLNEKTGKHFQSRHPNGDPTKALQAVHALLKKGYTAINLRQVIANRCLKWRDDEKMAEFLRPETLFRPSNFTNYFGELGKGLTDDANSTRTALS